MVAIWDVERRTEIADRGEELMGVSWMTVHDLCLLISEGAGFEHDAVWHRELAHVVEECPAADVNEVCIAQTHRVRQAHGQLGDAICMAFGFVVAEVQGACPSFQGAVVGAGQLKIEAVARGRLARPSVPAMAGRLRSRSTSR